MQSKNKIKKINIISNFVEFRKQNPNQTLKSQGIRIIV